MEGSSRSCRTLGESRIWTGLSAELVLTVLRVRGDEDDMESTSRKVSELGFPSLSRHVTVFCYVSDVTRLTIISS